jgi:hypothetical protein
MAGRLTGRDSERNVSLRRDRRIAALTGANINSKQAASEASKTNSQANMLQAQNQVLLQKLQNKGQLGVQDLRNKGFSDRLLAKQTFSGEQAGLGRDFKREQSNINLAGKGLLQGAFTGPEAQGVANSGAFAPNLAEITTKNKGGYKYVQPVYEETLNQTGGYSKMPVSPGMVFNPQTGELTEQGAGGQGGNDALEGLRRQLSRLYDEGGMDDTTFKGLWEQLGL